MYKKSVEVKTSSVTSIYTLTTFLTLTPPFNKNYRNGSGFKYYKCYAYAFLSLLITAEITILIFKIRKVYTKEPLTNCLTDVSVTVLLFSGIAVPNLRSTSNMAVFNTFFVLLKKIDQYFANKNSNQQKSHLITVELYVSQLYFLILLLYEAYIWIKYIGIDMYCATLMRDIPMYAIFVNGLLINNYILLFKSRFRMINDTLRKQKVSISSKLSLQHSQVFYEVKNIRNIYCKLCALINFFNDIFGWSIFILCAATLMGLIKMTGWLVSITTADNSVYVGKKILAVDFIALVVLWGVTIMVSYF